MKHLTKNLANWSRDERGNVAMAFAMMLVPMTMFVGGAVDFGVAMREQTKLQVAADAAALAGAAGTDVPEQTRQSNANKTFAANFDSTVISNIAPTVSINSAAVTVHAAAPVATKFLSLLHLNELDIEVTSVAKKQSSQTTTTSGGSKICLLALDPQSTDGIHIQGTNDVNYTNCWGYTNSSQATAINAVGTAIATGEGHCAAGDLQR